MQNGNTSSRNTAAAAAFILLASMLVRPGWLLCVPSWWIFFFGTGTIVLASAGTALLFPRRTLSVLDHLPRGLTIAAGTLLAIGIWHGIRHAGLYSADETGELFLTAVFPFCICVFAREIRRFLPWYLTILWLIDVILGPVQSCCGPEKFFFGLPGNVNLNASFLAVTAPFAILCVRRTVPNPSWRIALSVLVAGVTLWEFSQLDSRGAVLGILTAAALWGFLKTGRRGRQTALFTVLTLTIIGSLWLAFFAPHERILEYLSRDERVFLAHTTVDMILERPKLGFGAPSFPQEYLRFRAPEFFSMRHSSMWVEHPHNQLLYIAASFGILGLLCWLYLMLEPMFSAAKRFDRLVPETKLSLLCLAGMFVHAQFDLVLFHWPTNLFAMFFLGMLIHEREGAPAPFWRPPAFLRRFRWEFLKKLESARPPERRTGRLLPPALFALGLVLLGCGLFFAFGDLTAEAIGRKADITASEGDRAAAEGFYNEAAILHDEASRLYLTAASTPGSRIQLKYRALRHASIYTPGHAPVYYAMFASSSMPDFQDVNDCFARACVLGGNPRDALPFLKRAMTLRPYSVLPLLMLEDVYARLNSPGAFDAVQERLEKLMEYRNLDENDLETIRERKDLDLHTWFKRDPKIMKENDL